MNILSSSMGELGLRLLSPRTRQELRDDMAVCLKIDKGYLVLAKSRMLTAGY